MTVGGGGGPVIIVGYFCLPLCRPRCGISQDITTTIVVLVCTAVINSNASVQIYSRACSTKDGVVGRCTDRANSSALQQVGAYNPTLHCCALQTN